MINGSSPKISRNISHISRFFDFFPFLVKNLLTLEIFGL